MSAATGERPRRARPGARVRGWARSAAGALGEARWRLVVPAALGVVALTFFLADALVYVWENSFYLTAAGGDEPLGRGAPWANILWSGRFVGSYGLPALHFALTLAAATWVALRAGEWRAHGLLVGALATFYGQIAMLVVWPTVTPSQVLAGWGLLALPFLRMAEYLVLGLAAGFLGGVAARTALARREALVRASRGIGGARLPADVLAAVGPHLAGRGTAGISLWTASPSGGESFELLEAWPPSGSDERPRGTLDAARVPAVAGLRDRSPVVAKVRALPEPERRAWRKVGVRSLLISPLLAPGEERIGLLTVASRRRWRPFSGGAVRRYSTVATQAALALENMRLVEEARRVGQEAGTLRERNRLAREIHDTLAQGFVSIVMNLQASDGDGRDEKIERTARESLSEARRLVHALGPEQLENATLPEALENLARRFSEETGTRAEAVADGEPVPLPAGAEADLLRVAQEALHNVRKHAEADRVMLSLSYMGDLAVLDVRDDGRGFDPTHKTDGTPNGTPDGVSGGFGLAGMKTRLAERGGVLRVESSPGEGTTLTAELPAEAPGAGLRASAEDQGSRAEA